MLLLFAILGAYGAFTATVLFGFRWLVRSGKYIRGYDLRITAVEENGETWFVAEVLDTDVVVRSRDRFRAAGHAMRVLAERVEGRRA